MDMRVAPPGLESHVANRLLELLSTDDAFREMFVTDTKAAMAFAGYKHDERFPHPAGCFWPPSGRLAAKEDIAAAKEKIIATVCGIQGFISPFESQRAL